MHFSWPFSIIISNSRVLLLEKLKLGEYVEPEQFIAATIFFSDVVSFTTLASKCTPLQAIRKFQNSYVYPSRISVDDSAQRA